MRIDSSGRVGIGTTSPSTELHVAASSGYAELRLAGASGSGGSVEFFNSTTQLGDIFIDASNNMIFRNASEAFRVDSSRRLLVGTSSARSNFYNTSTVAPQLQIEGTTYSTSTLSIVTNNASGTGGYPSLVFGKSAGSSVGSNTAVTDGHYLGEISFQGNDGSEFVDGARITAVVDGTSGANDLPTRLVFSTTADGASSPTERMRIASGGRVSAPSWYDETTAVAANVNVASTGILQRSTSSIKYKTNVETIEDSYSDALLNCRPVWYRSTCANDNPNYGWWGFIAEEVAEIDPRLCLFEQKEDGNLEPEGVAYDRFVPHLLNLIKRQGEAIAELQAEVAALKGA
jgi:hypothetical protein